MKFLPVKLQFGAIEFESRCARCHFYAAELKSSALVLISSPSDWISTRPI